MKPLRHTLTLVAILLACHTLSAQRIIEYEAGMGTRDPENPAIWILYNQVRAVHDSMVLWADSAWLNTERNDFTAFGNIKIEITDTTTIFGDQLYYDGEQRMLDIWADTVYLFDGGTIMRTPQLSYDRNTSMASYHHGGITTSSDNTLKSEEGYYNSDTKELEIYLHVELYDSTMRLETDTLLYNTETGWARFVSPTYIYSGESTLYSEQGLYQTDTNYAISTRASRIDNGSTTIMGDTLRYWHTTELGIARNNVTIIDTQNNVICTGHYGITNQQNHTSLITDSAMVRLVQQDDSVNHRSDTLFLHADTIVVLTDTANQLQAVQASHHVKVYRYDVQGMSDSVYYSANDSLMRLFKEPMIWYDNYQCTADSIDVFHDTAGVRLANLNGHSMVVQQVDPDKFNQLKGKRAVVHFRASEPLYADILGNAQMVYYVTETDSVGGESLIGVNAGMGADMRIYFESRKPSRLVTYGMPDMSTYPLEMLPPELYRLPDFKWLPTQRPRKPEDIFIW